jgi:hypothetical protein
VTLFLCWLCVQFLMDYCKIWHIFLAFLQKIDAKSLLLMYLIFWTPLDPLHQYSHYKLGILTPHSPQKIKTQKEKTKRFKLHTKPFHCLHEISISKTVCHHFQYYHYKLEVPIHYKCSFYENSASIEFLPQFWFLWLFVIGGQWI